MFGTIKTTLRPLKFAFLIHPGDKTGLLKALEVNSVIWGGQFNPIILSYKRLPSGRKQSESRISAKDVFSGYLEAFDPDYVVPVGKITEPPFSVGYRKIISVEELLGKFEETGTLGYGIGLFDILRHLFHEELKFKRRFPLKIVFPEPYSGYSPFLASVLGTLPPGILSALKEHWTEPLGASWKHCEGFSYAELLGENALFPSRLSSLFLNNVRQGGRERKECVFILDAARMSNIVDFWNLRAMGWSVVPVPIQFSTHPEIQSMARTYINKNSLEDHANPAYHNVTRVLNSQHVTETQVDSFIQALKNQPEEDSRNIRVDLQHWYPRIWDSWARRADGVEFCQLEAETKTVDIPESGGKFRLKTLDPEFMPRFGSATNASFANMIDMRFYGATDLLAEVMPEGDHNLIHSVGGVGYRDWRFSRSGMSYLSSFRDWSIHFNIPDAESVFIGWFQQYGWSVALSSAGRIAKQTFLALRGSWGVHILTNEEVVKLLEKMSGENVMSKQALFGEISRIANLSRFPVQADGLLRRLTNDGIFRLGFQVQCPVCTQHSWYSLEDMAYTLQCLKCLDRFDIPAHSPNELSWSYRTYGPLSLPRYGEGSYSVLLTHYFFSSKLEGATTAILSFCAEKGPRKLEADLGLFYDQGRFGRREITLLFAECKSYGRFEERDIERMAKLGAEFPGAILIFSTLRRELSTKEKRMLVRVAKRGRKYSVRDPNHNPVLVLTGVELFSDERPPRCWRDAGGKFAKFGDNQRSFEGIERLCDATQQMHLDM